jgi:hypothetical protein
LNTISLHTFFHFTPVQTSETPYLLKVRKKITQTMTTRGEIKTKEEKQKETTQVSSGGARGGQGGQMPPPKLFFAPPFCPPSKKCISH